MAARIPRSIGKSELTRGSDGPAPLASLGGQDLGPASGELASVAYDGLTRTAPRFAWGRPLRLFVRRLAAAASLWQWLVAARLGGLEAASTDPQGEDAFEDAIRCREAIVIAGPGSDAAIVFEVLAHHR